MGANVSTVMIVVALVTGLWWGFARGRHAALLERFSVAALALAVVTLVVAGTALLAAEAPGQAID